jgi:hypothetical protein
MLPTVTSRLAVFLLAIIVLATGCTSLQAEQSPTVGVTLQAVPSPTIPATLQVEPSPTVTATLQAEPSSTVTAALQAETSPTTGDTLNQTGFAELDKIIAVALGGNVTELQQLLGFTSTNCTFAEGLGAPPKCLKTEKEGDPVEVLPFLGPEGNFLRKEDIGSWQGLEVSELYAVYQVSESAYSDKNFPTGEYAIVFIGNQEKKISITLQVKHGKIIRIDYGFVYPPEIRPDNVVRYLIPPINP